MPSSYSNSLRLELQATGEGNGTWGQKTNNNLLLVEEAMCGYEKIAIGNGGTYSLSFSQGSSDETRQATLEFTGTITSAAFVVAPAEENKWIVRNSTVGDFTLTFRTSSGTGLAIPQGRSLLIYTDGASVYAANEVAGDVSVSAAVITQAVLISALPVSSGGTGLSAVTSGAILCGSNTSALIQVSCSVTGAVLRSNGPASTPSFQLLTTIPVGGVVDFAGTSVPEGFIICDGREVSRTTYAVLFSVIGTTFGSGSDGVTNFNVPDLRGRVIAGLDNQGGTAANRLTSTYFGSGTVMGATGGLESHTMTLAELVSHFHSMTLTRWGGATGGGTGWGGDNVNLGQSIQNTNSTGSTSPFTIVQPTMVMHKIIYAGV